MIKAILFESIKDIEVKTDFGIALNMLRSIYLTAGTRMTVREEIIKETIKRIKNCFSIYNPTERETEQLKNKIESWAKQTEIDFVNGTSICAQQYIKIIIALCQEYFEAPEYKHTDADATDADATDADATDADATDSKTTDTIKPAIVIIKSIDQQVRIKPEISAEQLADIRFDLKSHAKLVYKILDDWYTVYRGSVALKNLTNYEMLGHYIEILYYAYGSEPNIKKWAEVISESYKKVLFGDFNMLLTYMKSLSITGYGALAYDALEEFVLRDKKYDSETEKKQSIVKNNHAIKLYLENTTKEKIDKYIEKHKNYSDYMQYQYAILLCERKNYVSSCKILMDLGKRITQPDYVDTLTPLPVAKVIAELCCDVMTGKGCEADLQLAKTLAYDTYSKFDDPTGELNIILASINKNDADKFREHCLNAFYAGNKDVFELATHYGYDDVAKELEDLDYDDP
jgi:hypothetical protein